MVRRILLVTLMVAWAHNSMALGQRKRFIIHYKKQGSLSLHSKQARSTTGQEIVSANSEEEAIRQFPLGAHNITEVEEDLLLQHFAEPGDFGGREDDLYYQQWHYFDSLGGIELPSVWDLTVGSSDTVVAVVDTGILNHPDLAGRILPGADLISDPDIANDGDGRDHDPVDSGDWISSSDYCFNGREEASSWHGTHVAGTIAANSANELGVSSVNWKAKILPIRVLGKCGGFMSDIADGIRWAAGGSVSGLKDNPHPAHVINLSLGGRGRCSQTIQAAINFARSKGSVVVVAAGNSGVNMDFTPFVPASCNGVLTVGAGNLYAEKSYYSNYGEDIDIMAPGGDSNGGILSLGNNGFTVEEAFSFKTMMGTSMAAPHVAGVASLILGENPELNPDQVEEIIKVTSKYFSCTHTQGCGPGLIDAFAAVQEALITDGEGAVSGTDNLDSDNSGSGDYRRVTYQEESSGGICGSVAFLDGNGGGPKGGLGAQLLSLALGLLLALSWTRTSKPREA
ncbi:MAG: peptidase S8 [Halobacteriovoraceae bacterium]|nr:peptidase S8 [Halobacteriovoraceae bacterium]